jgi:hypothetical protein
MTPERAQYIRTHTRLGGDYRYAFRRPCEMPDSRIYEDGITEAEHRYILAVWETMPGWTWYALAVDRIARGEA